MPARAVSASAIARFAGNTARDWLKLLIVPFVLPSTLAWFATRREAAAAEAAEPEVPRQVTLRDVNVESSVGARVEASADAPVIPARS